MQILTLHIYNNIIVLTEEVDDLKIVLQSADKELETIKKQRDLESIETGRALSSLESKVGNTFSFQQETITY